MNYIVTTMNQCVPNMKNINLCEWSYGFGPLGYGPVAEGRPVRMRRLPCCGLGLGWCLWVSLPLHMWYFPVFSEVIQHYWQVHFSPQTRFITGFFFAAIPWYIGAFVLICVRVHDHREKPGYVACTIAVSSFLLIQCNRLLHLWNLILSCVKLLKCCNNWNKNK